MQNVDELIDEEGYNAHSFLNAMEKVRDWASVYRQEMVEQLRDLLNNNRFDWVVNEYEHDFQDGVIELLDEENESLLRFEEVMSEKIDEWSTFMEKVYRKTEDYEGRND